jgi:hypothetical protein
MFQEPKTVPMLGKPSKRANKFRGRPQRYGSNYVFTHFQCNKKEHKETQFRKPTLCSFLWQKISLFFFMPVEAILYQKPQVLQEEEGLLEPPIKHNQRRCLRRNPTLLERAMAKTIATIVNERALEGEVLEVPVELHPRN